MERPHVATERPELMFEDVSVGQPRPTVAMNFAGPNFNDQHANGYHVHNQGLHGNFPPPPYNHGGPHLIVGDMMGNIHTRGNPKVKELEIDRNEDMYSMHNSDLSAHGEVHGIPFQEFEVVQMIKTPRSEDKKSVVSLSSLKDARAVVENGHPEGWGRVLDLPPTFDKLDLSFSHSKQGLSHEPPQVPNILTPVKFASTGFINIGQANVVGDDVDSDYDIDNWIRPSVPGEGLRNSCALPKA
ncbi:hypothetical protein KIW84_043217 [Lathyrus oleraceus]|uniref:Uncharacterized protein n=1 Tax=Pisum sativum TaxID=3888 RepID=A0A9D4XES4_PEA|nr:hypothetical protein KIW84_043217 [Pisum sativum]